MSAIGTVHMGVIVRMRMRVTMTMTMLVIMIVRVSVMFVEHLLCQRQVFGERRVVTVLVSATVGTRLGLEGHQGFGDVDI